MSGDRPPRWLERIVERFMPTGLWGQSALGDLAEEFERRTVRSRLGARAWYAGQTVSIVWNRSFKADAADRVFGRSQLWMDVRWSLRSMIRRPGFAFGVVTVLALGLAANVAVFSVVSGTFRNTSWWSNPDATVAVWPGREFSRGELTVYRDIQEAYRTLGAYNEAAFSLWQSGGESESESVNGVTISPTLFRELAAQPTLGRALSDDDAVPGAEPVVVLGDALWRRSFDADPDILGRTVAVNGNATTVVGIQATRGMAPGGRAELWIPLVLDNRDNDFWPVRDLNVMGVLQEGASTTLAFDDLTAFTDYLSGLHPGFYPPGFAAGRTSVQLADASQRRMISTPLLLLLGGTSLLMLVTALNVGNLLLGRAISRRSELAVRTALGASRRRIVAQLMVEGVVWTLLALAIGGTVAAFAGQWIADLFVGEVVVVSSALTSPPVLLFAGGLTLLTMLVLSGLPIVHYLRTQRTSLAVRPTSAAHTQRLLVTAQAALATMLLVSAALLVATVDNLRSVPLGFDADGLIAVELSPPPDQVISAPGARALYQRITDRVRAIPGVEAAGMTGALPLRAQALSYPVNLQSAPVDQGQATRMPRHRVDPGFFEALGISPLEGRVLGTEDRSFRPSAVVINQSMAQLLWPGTSPVGQMIAIDPHAWDAWIPVVGVIPDIRGDEITGPPGPAMYISLAESPARSVTLVVRASTSMSALVPSIRLAVAEVERLVPIKAVMSMDEVVKAAYSTSWVLMGLLIVLALLATVLGAVGIYAVLAHHVALTKREIGVRMALGAQPGTVIGGIVRSGMMLAAVGIVLGSLGALVTSRWLESLLFGVSSVWPLAFAGPAVALMAAAALAASIPAARAGRLPPGEVLRAE